jgi:hypothetical protein
MTIGRRTGFSEDTFCYGVPCRLVTFPGRYPRTEVAFPSTMASPVIVIYETSLASIQYSKLFGIRETP